MEYGQHAIFRLVNELLNEIQRAGDDLGKERTTDFGLDALYDIVDYRYRHELQTIITINSHICTALQ